MSPKKFWLEAHTLDKLHSVFKKFKSVERVLIYGSRAKGNFIQGSDIDLCIVGKELNTTDLLKIENEIEELLLPYKVGISLLSQIENKDLQDHVERLGEEFYIRR